ncbi:hypothetical protein BH11PSE7_BH11PSE7_15170 [soil metagenome]
MSELISGLARFIIKLILLAAGLVLAASVAVAVVLLLAVWTVRSTWARLTGRPVTPFVMRMNPRGGFDRMYRRPQAPDMQHGDFRQERREIADVTDVEVKEPGR